MTIVHGRERAISGIFSYSMSNMLLSSRDTFETQGKPRRILCQQAGPRWKAVKAQEIRLTRRHGSSFEQSLCGADEIRAFVFDHHLVYASFSFIIWKKSSHVLLRTLLVLQVHYGNVRLLIQPRFLRRKFVLALDERYVAQSLLLKLTLCVL